MEGIKTTNKNKSYVIEMYKIEHYTFEEVESTFKYYLNNLI